jgi:hypothetical protein
MNPPPAHCHKCQRVTETIYLPLRGGLIGNVCATCRACRRGRPYVTRDEYNQSLMPAPPAEGGSHANQTNKV